LHVFILVPVLDRVIEVDICVSGRGHAIAKFTVADLEAAVAVWASGAARVTMQRRDSNDSSKGTATR
jgi:hypothetical protein